jgi:hypothetical protein
MDAKAQADELYELYPRHVARGAAIKAIRQALKKVGYDVLREAVAAYAEARRGQDRNFTPHPATWFNQERWDDDRTEWTGRVITSPEQQKLDASAEAINGFLAKANAARVCQGDDRPRRIETNRESH